MRKVWIVALIFVLGGCGKNVETQVAGVVGSEPDKALYEQALKDLGRSRYTIARLTLNTLISTYPDSELLPEAKYAMAESFYREGATSNLNQAEAEFKDFITFFPIHPRADDAQLMIAMTHVRQIEKPDRDTTQAQLAEMELNRMIDSYPDSPLLDEAKDKLRQVQEVLAEGNFKVGNQYLIRKAYRAAMSRYREVLDKYPDFSRTSEVLFNLGEALRNTNNEQESAIYYGKIVSDYPYSAQVAEAKNHLTELKMQIPEPNPAAVARGQQVVKEDKGIFGRFFGTFGRRPNVSTDTKASSVRDQESPPDENKNNTLSIKKPR